MAEESIGTDQHTTSSTPKKSSGFPTAAKIAIGCVVLLVILGIVGVLAAGWVAKKAGTAILEKTIENETGVKGNIESLEEGKFSYTTENGTKVDIGSGEIPDNFPKDFPVYPGSQVTGTMSGSQGEQSGFWLTFSTKDDFAKVKEYYLTNLKTNGWTTEGTFDSETNTTLTVSKGTLQGTVTIDTSDDAQESTILVILGTAEDDSPTTNSQ